MRLTTSDPFSEDSVFGVAEFAKVSLGVLRDIECTIESLDSKSEGLDIVSSLASKFSAMIRAFPVVQGKYLDEDDTAIGSVETTELELKDMLATLVIKRKAIDKDHRLSCDHSEALHDAYERHITSVADVIDALQDFKAAIISHDLCAEPREGGEKFEDVTSLIASLRG